jgi:diaminobutyrate-2-oxoglutarate transaminase
MTNVTAQLESNVRSYCHSFPTVFAKASGSTLTDVQGRRYLDFFSGAGTLNYGHNHPVLKQRLLDYIATDGLVHGLDMATEAKQVFMEADGYLGPGAGLNILTTCATRVFAEVAVERHDVVGAAG